MRKNKHYGSKTVIANNDVVQPIVILDAPKQTNKFECVKCGKSYTKAYLKTH